MSLAEPKLSTGGLLVSHPLATGIVPSLRALALTAMVFVVLAVVALALPKGLIFSLLGGKPHPVETARALSPDGRWLAIGYVYRYDFLYFGDAGADVRLMRADDPSGVGVVLWESRPLAPGIVQWKGDDSLLVTVDGRRISPEERREFRTYPRNGIGVRILI